MLTFIRHNGHDVIIDRSQSLSFKAFKLFLCDSLTECDDLVIMRAHYFMRFHSIKIFSAKDVVFGAIAAGKHVVTANKALIAAFLPEIQAALAANPTVR